MRVELLSYDLFRHILYFCTPLDLVTARSVARAWRDQIPTEWTMEQLVLTDTLFTNHRRFMNDWERTYRSPSNLLTKRRICTFPFIEKIVGMHIQDINVYELSFGAQFQRVYDINLMHILYTERLTFSDAMRAVRFIMLYSAYNMKQIRLPSSWVNLRSLYVSDMPLLEGFELDPAWTQLTSITLHNIGKRSHMTIPSTYTNLDFVQLGEFDLQTLHLEFDWTVGTRLDRVMVHLRERLPVRIHGCLPLNEMIIIHARRAYEYYDDLNRPEMVNK